MTLDDQVAVSAKLSPETRKTLDDLLTQEGHLPAGSSQKIQEIFPQGSAQGFSDSPDHTHYKESKDLEDIKSISLGSGDGLEVENHDPSEKEMEDVFDETSNLNPDNPPQQTPRRTSIRTIEITLRTDSEFFNLLTKELKQIDGLQTEQKQRLTSQVTSLGRRVLAVARPGGTKSSSDLYAWREIFSLYRDAAIFFVTTERHYGSRTAEEAKNRIQWFQTGIETQTIVNAPVFNIDFSFESLRIKKVLYS